MDPELAEVRALEAEIAALRRACEEPPAPGEDTARVQKSFQEIYQSDSEGWKSIKDLRSNLGHLESELLFLSTLTGINIRNYSKKTENLTSTEMKEKSIKKVLQRHRLSGTCHMITFQLEFQILEVQNKENLSSVITDLNIITEPTAYSELSEFVSRYSFCKKEKAQKSIKSYNGKGIGEETIPQINHYIGALAPELLSRAASQMTEEYAGNYGYESPNMEKYPEAVHLSEGASSRYMRIQSASQPGFELVIVWRIQIDEEGKVLPKLDLLTKVPHQALELDKKGVIETAPLGFRTLLGVLGIEAAVESLITSLCTEEN